MTKLYYDDALQAAFMAKEFGVLFTNGDNFETAIDIAGTIELTAIPFIVSGNSLSIFNPQTGDIVFNDCESPSYPFIWEDDDEAIPYSIDIIMRDNKPFFMPKQK